MIIHSDNYCYNNYDNLKSKGNNTSEGLEAWSTFNSTNGRSSGYAAKNGFGGRSKDSAQYEGHLNQTTQDYTLRQRTVTNEVINPSALTGLLKRCKQFENLKILYNEHKDKPYFNCIHASACLSQAIKFKCEGHETITPEELTVFKDKVLSYSKELSARTLANLANDAVKLLHYAKNKNFKDAKECEKIAQETLAYVFQEVINREKLEDFQPQNLSNLANDAVKLLDCAQNKNFKNLEDLEKLACETLACIFQSVANRKDLQHFEEQALANLANAAMKFLNYTQNKNFKNLEDLEKLACKTLACIFQEITSKESLQGFIPQELANITSALVQAGYWDERASELLSKIGKDICQRNFKTFELQGICNLAWSFSVGNQFSLIYDWLRRGLLQLDCHQIHLGKEDANELYMAFLRKALDDKKWNQENPNAFLSSYLNKDFAQKILQEINAEVIQNHIKTLKTSLLQKNVRSALEKVLPKGYSLEEEYYIKPYPIDFAVFKHTGNSKYKKLIALIEVNGPTHFMCNGDYNLPHQFKENLLESMGYPPIINIDYIEWLNLRHQIDQESFLKKKLSHLIELRNGYEIQVSNNVNRTEELIKLQEIVTKKLAGQAEGRLSIESKAETLEKKKTQQSASQNPWTNRAKNVNIQQKQSYLSMLKGSTKNKIEQIEVIINNPTEKKGSSEIKSETIAQIQTPNIIERSVKPLPQNTIGIEHKSFIEQQKTLSNGSNNSKKNASKAIPKKQTNSTKKKASNKMPVDKVTKDLTEQSGKEVLDQIKPQTDNVVEIPKTIIESPEKNKAKKNRVPVHTDSSSQEESESIIPSPVLTNSPKVEEKTIVDQTQIASLESEKEKEVQTTNNERVRPLTFLESAPAPLLALYLILSALSIF